MLLSKALCVVGPYGAPALGRALHREAVLEDVLQLRLIPFGFEALFCFSPFFLLNDYWTGLTIASTGMVEWQVPADGPASGWMITFAV